jgi:hypothetical protein
MDMDWRMRRAGAEMARCRRGWMESAGGNGAGDWLAIGWLLASAWPG